LEGLSRALKIFLQKYAIEFCFDWK